MENKLYGKILKGVGGLYEVMTSEGRISDVGLRGVFRYDGIKPYIGDDVTVLFEDGNKAVIDEISERRNFLIRPPVSNLDMLFIVAAAAKPDPELVLIDKLITIAEYNKIEPVIVISKCDVDPEKAMQMQKIYSSCSFDTYCISSAESTGIDGFREFVVKTANGKTAAFAGASGVGKSTLMNALFPSLELETGEISRKISRGKHTTRHVQLYPICELTENANASGYIADTPGFGLLDFVHFDFYTKEDLPYTFREFEPYIGKCRYTKCTHTKEDGCAVIEAVKNGNIPRERHESFCAIYDDVKNKHPWDRK